jgi:hypothetical protein
MYLLMLPMNMLPLSGGVKANESLCIQAADDFFLFELGTKAIIVRRNVIQRHAVVEFRERAI